MSDQPSKARWIILALAICLLGSAAVVCFERARRNRFDFSHFYHDATYVWRHGMLPRLPDPLVRESLLAPTAASETDQRRLSFYLPSIPVLLAPLMGLGLRAAAAVWTALQVAALGCVLLILRRWALDTPPGLGPSAASQQFREAERGVSRGASGALTLIVAACFALAALYEWARFNQLTVMILALVLGGVLALQRGQRIAGGGLLGLAAVIKLLPAIFLPWLLLKRQWTAAMVFVAVFAYVAVVPSLVAFGPAQTRRYYEQWWRTNVHGAAGHGMTDAALREHFIDYRNQALPAVLARLAWSEHPYRVEHQPFHLSAAACYRIGFAVIATLGLALLWFTRRPVAFGAAASGSPATRPLLIETALVLLAMLVLSPLLRTYYLAWALPALVVFTDAARAEMPAALRRAGTAGLLIWLAGMLGWLFPAARTLGVHFVMLLAMAGVLVWIREQPSAISRKP
jgi:hypothetical protein